MTPQEKQVFSKLFPKTELGTHKVDLALIDDLNKLINESKSNYKEFNDSFNKMNDFRKLVLIEGDRYVSSSEKLIDIYQKISVQAKDLGINFTNTNEAKSVRDILASGDPSFIKKTLDKLR